MNKASAHGHYSSSHPFVFCQTIALISQAVTCVHVITEPYNISAQFLFYNHEKNIKTLLHSGKLLLTSYTDLFGILHSVKVIFLLAPDFMSLSFFFSLSQHFAAKHISCFRNTVSAFPVHWCPEQSCHLHSSMITMWLFVKCRSSKCLPINLSLLSVLNRFIKRLCFCTSFLMSLNYYTLLPM